MTFASLGLIAPLAERLATLGYATPTPIQARAIPAVLAGRDLLAAAQTGTGKTAAFALPLLQQLVMQGPQVQANRVRVLVLVPTRELAGQVHASVLEYGGHMPLRTAVAFGGISINPQMMKLRKGLDLLVATPGRLLDLHQQNAVQFDQLRCLVLDEADRMLDLGFAREIDAVLAALPKARQTLLFSATFSAQIRALAANLLIDPLTIEISAPNSTVSAIRQSVITVDKKRKPELFLHLLKKHRWQQVLVFVRTRKGVDQLVELLAEAGVAAEAIHGDRPQPARLRALARFKAGEVPILVATDVAARGIDIDALPQVVHFDLPIVAEDYIHRTGRTGRAGAGGQAVALVAADEAPLLAAIETLTGKTLPRIDEPGFVPEHRVPDTDGAGKLVKKPKKPKKPKFFTAPTAPSTSTTGKKIVSAKLPSTSGRHTSPAKPPSTSTGKTSPAKSSASGKQAATAARAAKRR